MAGGARDTMAETAGLLEKNPGKGAVTRKMPKQSTACLRKRSSHFIMRRETMIYPMNGWPL